jgi:eukaryotic-like serine/threonine-protein kinase
VAVKLLKSESHLGAETIERFRREADLAGRISHPGICAMYGFEQHPRDGGELATFIVMELLDGQTLYRRRVQGGRLTADEALPIVVQLSHALAAAHQVGVIHRDFKSGNVMIVKTATAERVVVTDFGLARPARAGMLASLTETGDLLGTPLYMSPEQVRGATLTPATDIYALGVVMFEIVTGGFPFGDDPGLPGAFYKLLGAAPQARTIVKDLPRRWSRTIARCLERLPEDRFQSAIDVAAALQAP